MPGLLALNLKSVNWNNAPEEDLRFWRRNIKQFWVDEEIPISNDKSCWEALSDKEKTAFVRILAGLTLLDTWQGKYGMPLLVAGSKNPYSTAVFSFMSMMENMHAKSYSSIFTTLLTTAEINQVFSEADNNKYLRGMLDILSKSYDSESSPSREVRMMYTSIFLESFLFYSGFYYPLLLAGRGKMVNSGEIISLIIRDEYIHGLYTGRCMLDLLAQARSDNPGLYEETKNGMVEMYKSLNELQSGYIKSVFGDLDLTEDVQRYVNYRANFVFSCFNQAKKTDFKIELPFPIDSEDIRCSSIVKAGISQKTKMHDFFSTKGNGYTKALKIEDLKDEDFV